MTERTLLDTDGENRAVRAFLMLYGTKALTVGEMKRHMEQCGFPFWPDWVEPSEQTDAGKAYSTFLSKVHLTKAGAQSWLRYLFSLEAK